MSSATYNPSDTAATSTAREPASAGGGAGHRERGGGTRKVSFNFPTDELEVLSDLAERRSTTRTQVLRQALSTERYLQELIDDGARLLFRIGRGPLREIVFPHMRRRP